MAAQSDKVIQLRERHLNVLIHEISLMVSRTFNRRVKEAGLTRSQWHVLYLLHEGDGQTQTEIAEHLAMAKPPVGKIVDRLEGDGWVERRDDPRDRRANRVFLTEKVMPLISPLESVVDEIGDITTRGLNKADREAFARFLHIAHQNWTGETGADND
ncbi:MAG: MarR family transcriptional regulator [Gammaproteobacteria bacterium]|nr:MarR family transcriptional regulator [Gammaproteobacteria bacterium]